MKSSRAALALFTAVLLLAGCQQKPRGPAEPAPVEPSPVERAMAFYATRVYYEQPVVATEVPEGLLNLRAETCGVCHKAIYEEWAVSTHRRAWLDDAQFQAELRKSAGAGDPDRGDISWMCINCHTPVVAQHERLVIGLDAGKNNEPQYVDNPTYDEVLQLEAITCATCHVRDGVVLGPFGDTEAPHATAKDETLLQVDVCTRCHQAERMYSSENLGCFFGTGREWGASQYAEAGRTCQSCHMPEIERKLAFAFDTPIRKTRRHWFGGSLIPKKPEYESEIAPLRKVYGDGVTITHGEATAELRAIAARAPALAAPDQKTAKQISVRCRKCSRKVAIIISNDRAGHYMPTGDPERHIDVAVTVSKNGRLRGRTWTRIGSRYAWWPEVKLLADTRIPPGERRVLIVPVPPGGEVEIVASKARMYEEAFEYHHLEGRYVAAREFFRERFEVSPRAP